MSILVTRRKFIELCSSMVGWAHFSKVAAFAATTKATSRAVHRHGACDLSIWFEQPTDQWADALPVGNGRLGAMVFGGVQTERIALNEDTLWSGSPRDWNNPEAKAHLPTVRRLVIEEQNYQAADQECRKMQGPFNQAYEPLGDLTLAFDYGAEAASTTPASYRRSLNLDSAVAQVEYKIAGSRYVREVFASAPDQVIVVRLTSSRRHALHCSVKLTSQMQSKQEARRGHSSTPGSAA